MLTPPSLPFLFFMDLPLYAIIDGLRDKCHNLLGVKSDSCIAPCYVGLCHVYTCSHRVAATGPRVCSFVSFFYIGYPPFESLTMSLKGSDDLVLLDGPVLEAEDLHPRVVPEGMTMNALPSEALGLYAHHFQQGGLRVPFSSFFLKDVEHFTLIAMAWLHHDSNVADPFPKSNEYNASDVTKLREVVISLRKPPPSLLYVAGLSNVWKHVGHAFYLKDSKGKVLSMAEFLRLSNFKGCKITAGVLLPPGTIRVTHLANPAVTLEAIPPKTADMVVVEIPCRKVLDDKEKKRKKAKEKAAVNSPAVDIQAEKVGIDKDVGKDGPHKKRKVGSTSNATCLRTCQHLETVEKLVCDKVVPGEEASYSAGRFGNLCFAPQWGLTNPGRMDNSYECRDMMSNLFTPADHEFFNEGVRDESAIRRSWKMLCQSAQQQANTLLCFEALTEEHADLVYAHESCKDVKASLRLPKAVFLSKNSSNINLNAWRKVQAAMIGKVVNTKQLDRIWQLEEALKQFEAEADQLRQEKEHYAVEAGRGEMMRQRIINQYLPTFVRRLHQIVEYKRSLGRVFSLAIGKVFIDGISIGRKDVDIQAILKATPDMDPTSSDVFIGEYKKLFDQRYLYVDKVARMYLLDPSGLQNVMPNKTGPTHGEGPHDTPMPSYA
ncbi:hypothetical protein Tco_0356112 [Tanacetum coccineum]